MSKLMIKGQQASGTYGNASDIKINEISGLTASNAQEALVALNNSLTTLDSNESAIRTEIANIRKATNTGTTYSNTKSLAYNTTTNFFTFKSTSGEWVGIFARASASNYTALGALLSLRIEDSNGLTIEACNIKNVADYEYSEFKTVFYAKPNVTYYLRCHHLNSAAKSIQVIAMTNVAWTKV